jgi:hypothetical protein
VVDYISVNPFAGLGEYRGEVVRLRWVENRGGWERLCLWP